MIVEKTVIVELDESQPRSLVYIETGQSLKKSKLFTNLAIKDRRYYSTPPILELNVAVS